MTVKVLQNENHIEILAEVHIAGMLALKKALGSVGTVRFLQQSDQGKDDYTKEKYNKPEPPINEVIAGMESIETKP